MGRYGQPQYTIDENELVYFVFNGFVMEVKETDGWLNYTVSHNGEFYLRESMRVFELPKINPNGLREWAMDYLLQLWVCHTNEIDPIRNRVKRLAAYKL